MEYEKTDQPSDEIFGEVIHSYSRAQAIEDGVLVDLMQGETRALVLEAGFKYPVAMTATAYSEAVAPFGGDLPEGQDLKGRLWDVLMVLRHVIRRSTGGSVISFAVVVYRGEGKNEVVSLKSVCGPGDDPEPVITIMLPGED